MRLPLVIEAVKWDPDGDVQEVFDWLTAGNAQWGITGSDRFIALMAPAASDGTPNANIHQRVDPGDWIIKGVAGDFYKIDDVTFGNTYEKT